MAKKQSGTISKRMAKRAEQRRKKRQTQIVLIIAAVVILAGVTWAVLGNGSSDQIAAPAQGVLPREVSVSTANTLYQEGAYILDVRTQEEWDDYHIPETTLIPLDDLATRVDEVPRDQEVVVVCRSGNRSQVGRDILMQAGFTQVTSMSGGVNDWRSAGYPIE